MDVIEAIKKNVIKRMLQERGADMIDTPEVEVKEIGRYYFVAANARVKTMSNTIVYGKYCFGHLGIEEYYKSSNVVDATHRVTVEQALSSTQNYFNHFAKKFNELKP